MIRILFLAGILSCCSTGLLFADFSYEQSSKITGGMMAGMMKFAGAFSKQAREPMKMTIMVKGDRMATVTNDSISVIDLSSETMTEINLKKKTYSSITFAEMAQAMEQMAAKAAGQKKDPNADVSFKADVKTTGQTRQINGFDTKQTLMTLELEGRDKQSGDTGALMIIADMWMAPKVPGYQEVTEFYGRMAKKINWAPGGGMLSAMANSQPGMREGFAEVSKQASELEGIPVLQITRMGAKGQVTAASTDESRAAAPEQSAPDTASKKTGRFGGLAGGLAGGGFGGFGRKKKAQEQEPAPEPEQQGQNADASGLLMELTTETTSFSSAAVDASKFEVPSGFKQVESDMQKALR